MNSTECLVEVSLLSRTIQVLDKCHQALAETTLERLDIARPNHGKMLRTRLAAALLGDSEADRPAGIPEACAAIELIHSASLCHDDVVDGASLRRGRPTLWRAHTQNIAVLTGDVLFCEALRVLSNSPAKGLLPSFLEKVREVCLTEAEQELALRGQACDATTCLRVARGKTGPLFAFIGQACGGQNRALAEVLEEAGYRIGTAYQLADDWLDENGDEATIGKTLGTDKLRKKYTLAQDRKASREELENGIRDLCDSAIRILDRWPSHQAGLRAYIEAGFIPSEILKN